MDKLNAENYCQLKGKSLPFLQEKMLENQVQIRHFMGEYLKFRQYKK